MKEMLNVDGMNCNHCIDKITRFVGEIEGVKNIQVSLESKSVEVEFETPANLEMIREAIEDAGFSVK